MIKAPVTYPQLIVPLALLTPWRLPLLFAVSGYASRKLFDRSGDPDAFVALRNRRLLIPWSFAMLDSSGNMGESERSPAIRTG